MAHKAKTARILLVDDSPDTLEVLRRHLSGPRFDVLEALSGFQALEVLTREPIDLVVTDMKMPGMTGLELLRKVREGWPDTEVMVITGYATVEGAVQAVKTGAEEYLAKPFTEEELLAAVERSLDKLRAARAKRGPAPPSRFGLIGATEVMRAAFAAMELAGGDEAPVLVAGEPGTGRESAARAIHGLNRRAGGPFLAINAEALNAHDQESELETAARLAVGGSLYVRCADLLAESALKMLAEMGSRALESPRIFLSAPSDSGAFARGSGGGDTPNLHVIFLPPLRERGQDILSLAGHFVTRAAEFHGLPAPALSDDARRVMLAYEWPGNVSEMRQVLDGAAIRSRGGILTESDLPARLRAGALGDAAWERPLAEVEAEHIRRVLAGVKGNKTRAAEVLGMDRKTLRQKLHQEAPVEDGTKKPPEC